MEKGLKGSGAGTLGVPLGGTRRVGGLLGYDQNGPGRGVGWGKDIASGDRNHLPLHQTPELGEAAIAEEAGQRLETPPTVTTPGP